MTTLAKNSELKKVYCLEVACRLAKYPQYDQRFVPG